jgi:Flp pilus assembly protein TadD
MILKLFPKRVAAGTAQEGKSRARTQAGDLAPASTASRSDLHELLNTVDIANASGRYVDSFRAIQTAMLADPDDPELIFARGVSLLGWSRHWEALWAYESLLAREWTDRRLPMQFAYAHLALGHAADADVWVRRALELDPDDASAKDGLINTLMHQGKTADAIGAWLKFFGPDDRNPRRLNWMVYCKTDTRDFSGAELVARRLVAVDAHQPGTWINLGIALNGLDRREEALHAFQEATRLGDMLGGEIDAFVNVAKQSLMLGQLDTCIEILEARLPSSPSIEGHLVYAEALLKAGRFAEGWQQYEFRWMRGVQAHLRHGPSRPVWSGQDLRGRTIFVRKEQGIGDALQFIRYLPRLKRLGATVLLQSLPGIPLTIDGVDRVVAPDESPDYDYYIDFLSLPRAFGTGLDDIPSTIPYLSADDDRIARWSKRLGSGGGLRVGLVWAGNPVHTRDGDRSMPLQAMEPLLGLENVRFFSLQKGSGEAQVETLTARDRLDNLADGIADFGDTAAIISLLDLVICVDTAVAHLAGALGQPVWLLLQKDGEWRWLSDDRSDSPWYPTMRIFRQSVQRDWQELVARVRAALEEVVRGETSLKAIPNAQRDDAQQLRPVTAFQVPSARTRVPALAIASEGRAGILQHFPTDSPESDSLFWYGEYLQPQLDLIFDVIKPGATVVEVAPGIGAQSLQIANRLGSKGHLFLFESRPLTCRVLNQNLTVNGVRNITILRRALDHQGVEPERRSLVHGFEGVADAQSPGIVPSAPLDDYSFDQLHLLKIGIDAEALTVLEGAATTLWRLRPVLFVTVADGLAFHRIAAFVKELGYRCWRMDTAVFSPENFNRRREDIFSGQSVLALIAIAEELEVDIDLGNCAEA